DRVEGEVWLVASGHRRPARRGEGVAAGEGLETAGAKAFASARFDDGTRIELLGPAAVQDVGARSLSVSRGAVQASVVRQKQTFVVTTPHSEVRVLGTKFRVIVAETTRVEVEEGRVRCRRLSDGATVEIAAGLFALAGKGVPLAVRAQTVTRSFQDGPEYSGTRDTSLSWRSPGANLGSAELLPIHKSNDNQFNALFKWDVSSIPPGSRVLSAEVSLYVTGASPGTGYRAYEIRRPWEEIEATWKVATSTSAWQVGGGQADGDRGSRVLFALTPEVAGPHTFPLNEAGVAVVQAWVNAPAANQGVVLCGSTQNNKWEFYSRESSSPERRPKLTIKFVAAGR
ncbi:MAG: DNRLRE domain-containing protein, partial [Candidatus Rokuibacteriota bacterium]